MSPSRTLPFILPVLFGAYALEFGTISLLPLITNRLNVSVSLGSVFMAVFTLLIAVSGPILTLFSSQINRKKFLIVALFFVASGNIFSAYATDILSLMAARLVPALIHPMLFPTVFALAISLYPKRRKTFVIFLGVAGAAAGLILSVPLAAFLGAHVSFSSTFLFFAAFNATTALVLIWRTPPKPTYGALRLKMRNRRQLAEPRHPITSHERIVKEDVVAENSSLMQTLNTPPPRRAMHASPRIRWHAASLRKPDMEKVP